MLAKPLYGILSNAIYIDGAHGIPYICIGGKLAYSYVALSFICFSCFLWSDIHDFIISLVCVFCFPIIHQLNNTKKVIYSLKFKEILIC